MVDNKSKDDINTTTTARSTEATNFYDTVKNNYIRIVDEFTKAQPQYTQSVSNLQLDYIAATKNTIQNMVSAQKMLASNGNVPIVTPPYTDEFVKQSNEITENIVRAVRINNQLTVNAINAAAENFRTLNRTIESVTEFNTSAAKAWNSFLTVQQQQFLHKQ
jgi:transketolase